MNKPNEYDNTKAMGQYEPVELGGHYMVIKQVVETTSKTGQEMIMVCFDFSKEDGQADKFVNEFRDDVRPDKKWPNQGTKYVLVNDPQTGNTSRAFKSFCTCAEESNTGFEIKWGANWGQQFRNRKIGGVFGEEKDFYNGKEVTKRVLKWFAPWDKVKDAAIPKQSTTKAYREHLEFQGHIATGDFMSIPDGLEEELPFV